MSGNREAVMNDKLVLISPYNPKAHFTIGNAMGRNKIIYALSDASVVVSSSVEKGGTWHGAVENLKKWNIPLYVREAESYLGNSGLIKKGGKPFPLEALKDTAALITPFQPESVPDMHELDVYESILADLLAYTTEPRSRKDIAAFLKVTATQAGIWLDKALKEGRLEKKNRPVRYVTCKPDDSKKPDTITGGQQRSLFGED